MKIEYDPQRSMWRVTQKGYSKMMSDGMFFEHLTNYRQSIQTSNGKEYVDFRKVWELLKQPATKDTFRQIWDELGKQL